MEDQNDTECICSDLQHDDYSPAYAWFNYIVIIVLLPSVSVFGVASNIVNICIYSSSRMRSSSNTYLLFLACSDILVILTGLFIFWIDSARSYIPELSSAPYTTVYTLPFGYMAQSCSIYFTVAAAVDCYINVCWKAMSAAYCTVRRARQINTYITICSIIYNSLRFPQFNLRKCLHDGSQEIIVEICPTPLFFAINTIYNVYMYMVLMTLLPFLFLSIINAIIVLQQSSKVQGLKSMSQSDSAGVIEENASGIAVTVSLGQIKESMFETSHGAIPERAAADADSDDTITMIMVVVLFLCCNTLALIINIIETFFEPDALLLNFLTDGSNFLVVLNSSVNCVIYFTFNKDYREVLLLHLQTIGRRLKCADRVANSPVSFQAKMITADKNAASIVHNSSFESVNQCNSPVWRQMYPANGNCHFPSHAENLNISSIFSDNDRIEIRMDDDDRIEDAESDSGWADTLSVKEDSSPCLNARTFTLKHWIAEVHDIAFGSSQSQVYVRPLQRYMPSVTTL